MASNQAAKKRWRLAAAGLLVAAITALALAWTAYNVIHTVNGQSEYYQVHDYYAENQVMLAADPAEGWTQGSLRGRTRRFTVCVCIFPAWIGWCTVPCMWIFWTKAASG